MKLIKLIPGENDKYHFGEGDLTDSSIIFHSHSLYSAIINNFIKLYGVDEFNKHKEKLENIRLSSLLPAIYKLEDGKLKNFIYFLPKPATRLGFDKETQKKVEEKPKEIKKVQFISINALQEHNKGELKKNIIGKEFLVSDNEYKELKNYENPDDMKLFESFIEQKVAIDRIKQMTLEEEKGQLYSVGYVKPLIYINKNSCLIVGYYFLLDFKGDNDLLKKIESAIRLIKDEGLGGERSNGAGLFKKVIIEEISDVMDLATENNNNSNNSDSDKNDLKNMKWMTLSTTIPKNEEEFKKIISYQLMRIGGYVYSSSNYSSLTKAKKYIYAIKEGAMIEEEIEGEIVDIHPKGYDHEVLVNGKPILIPTKYYEG